MAMNDSVFANLQDFAVLEAHRKPRCNQHSQYISGAVQCDVESIINPISESRAMEDRVLSRASGNKEAVQIRPQRVSLKLRQS